MASLSNEAGRRVIYASLPGRPKIALGRIPKKQAESILRHVEDLTAAKLDGSSPHPATSEWLAGVDDKLRKRLALLGLATPRTRPATFTLAEAAEKVVTQKVNWAEGTRVSFDQHIRIAKEFFGARRDLKAVTTSDVRDFQAWLISKKGQAETTASLCLRHLSQCFAVAIESRAMDYNPVAAVAKPNRPREKPFISAKQAEAVMKELTPPLQTLFALSRYGGLRTPSEHRGLTWDRVNLPRRRMTVYSPKTKTERVVPIFPELLPYLEAAWDAAEEGDTFVCPAARGDNSTLTAQIQAAAKRAGVARWRSTFHALRSSRVTELLQAGMHPHKVAKWIGHTIEVQQAAYATVTEDDIDAAAGLIAPEKMGAEMGAEHARNEGNRDERRAGQTLA